MGDLTKAKVDFFKYRIKYGKMTIEEVPEKYRQYLVENDTTESIDDLSL